MLLLHAPSALIVALENLLDESMMHLQAAQTELDAVAEDFRKLHVERQALLNQAEAAIANLRKRDEDIRSAGSSFASTKDRLQVQGSAT